MCIRDSITADVSNVPIRVSVSTVNLPPVLSVTAACAFKNPVGIAVSPVSYPLNGMLLVNSHSRSVICILSSIALICAVVVLVAPTT